LLSVISIDMSTTAGKATESGASVGSPQGAARFLIPSPLPTRRNRTSSLSEKAKAGPVLHGRIKSFCREKGHGFIVPDDGLETIFVHVSDIEGELVPLSGDEVSYKLCPLPPKFEKFSATHVVITHAKEGSTHERWDGGANLQPDAP